MDHGTPFTQNAGDVDLVRYNRMRNAILVKSTERMKPFGLAQPTYSRDPDSQGPRTITDNHRTASLIINHNVHKAGVWSEAGNTFA